MTSTKTISRGIRLPNELWERLEQLAGKEKDKVNEYVAKVLGDHVWGGSQIIKKDK